MKPPNATPSSKELATAMRKVSLLLAAKGFSVWVPFFAPPGHVDLLYEGQSGLVRRVQCQSAQIEGTVLLFSTKKLDSFCGGEVDDFGLYCAENNSVYLVPATMAPFGRSHLRPAPMSHHHLRRVREADRYILRRPPVRSSPA